VHYFGGPVLDHVNVEAVFLGSQWTTDPTGNLQNLRLNLDQFLSDIVNSSYLDQLREYSIPGHTIGRGSFLGDMMIPVTDPSLGGNPDGALSNGKSLSQNEIQNILTGPSFAGLDQFSNNLLVTFLPPGVQDNIHLAGVPVKTNMPGYHFRVGDQGTTPYAVIEDPVGTHPEAFGQGWTEFTYMTDTASHELAEAVTEPQGNAWNNGGGGFGWLTGEIGDLSDHPLSFTPNGTTYTVASLFSNLREDVGSPGSAVHSPAYSDFNNLASGQGNADLLMSAPNVQWSGFTDTGGPAGAVPTPPDGSLAGVDTGAPIFYELTTDGNLFQRRMLSGSGINLTTGGDYSVWALVDTNVSQADISHDTIYYLHPDGTLMKCDPGTGVQLVDHNVQSFVVAKGGSSGLFVLHFGGGFAGSDSFQSGEFVYGDIHAQAVTGTDQGFVALDNVGGNPLYTMTWNGHETDLGINVQSFAVVNGSILFLTSDGFLHFTEFDGSGAQTTSTSNWQSLQGFSGGGLPDEDFELQDGTLTGPGIVPHAPYMDSNVTSFVVGDGGQWLYDLRADGTLNFNNGNGWQQLDAQVQSITSAAGLGIYELKSDGTLRYISPSLIAVDAGGNVTPNWQTVATGVESYSVAGRYGIELQVVTRGSTVVPLRDLPAGITVTEGLTFNSQEGSIFNGNVAAFVDVNIPGFQESGFPIGVTVSIDWGDGTVTPADFTDVIPPPSDVLTAGTITIHGHHTYTEEGTYFPVVTITDVNAGQSTLNVTSTGLVTDAPLQAAGGLSNNPVAGVSFTGTVATFSDLPLSATGTLSDYTATIAWGDGTSSLGTITADPTFAGWFDVSGTHTFTQTGFVPVAVTITDVGGSSVVVHDTATINSLIVTGDPEVTGNTITLETAPTDPTLYEVLVNGQLRFSGPWSSVTGGITLNGDQTPYTFNVENIAQGAAVTVNTGAGNDTINVSPVAKSLESFSGSLTVNGGAGTDTLLITDASSSPAASRTYDLSSIGLLIPELPGVNIGYTLMANVELDAGQGKNAINVTSTSANTTINAGSAGDTITVGPCLDNIGRTVLVANNSFATSGTLNVHADGGALILDDQATQDVEEGLPAPGDTTTNVLYAPAPYTVSANEVDRSTQKTVTTITADPIDVPGVVRRHYTTVTQQFSYSAAIHYWNASRLEIDGAMVGAGTPFTVGSTAAGTPVAINIGSPATVNLGAGNLDNLPGAVTVNGAGATTAVNLNDQAGPTTATDVLTASSYSRPNFGGLTYGNVGSLTVSVAPGTALGGYRSSQNVIVTGTAAGTATTINAASGANNITVGLPTNPAINTTGLPGSPLDNIRGPLTLNGDYMDILTLWDWDSSSAQKTYAINTNSIVVTTLNGVAVANPVTIGWQGNLSVVALYGSAAADTYQLLGRASNMAALVVNGYYRENTFQSFLPQRTWDIYANQAVGSYVPGQGAIDLGEVWNFTGGPGGDTFQFAHANGADGALDGVLNGNGGTLDYSQDASPVAVNLANNSATNLNGGAAGGFANIQAVIGNNSSTTLVGPNQIDYWNLTGSNQGNLGAAQQYQPGPFTFRQIPNLIGGDTNDVFQFAAGAAVSGVLDGGGGVNMLDYSQYPAGVTVDLTGQDTPTNPADPFGGPGAATGTAHVRHIQNLIGSRFNDTLIGDDEPNVIMPDGGLDLVRGNGGDDTVRIWGPQDPGTSIDGGGGSNTLWAADFPNTWAVTRQNTGNVLGTVPGFVSGAGFSHVQNLLGGLNTDTFSFADGAGVDGWVNGNAGVNTLDYTAYTTPVLVNLSQFGTWGNAMNAPRGAMFIQIVIGSRTADNYLTGNSQGNILIGGAGNNTLVAGGGNSILIGGSGSDHLVASGGTPGFDILIAGTTDFDSPTAANLSVLTAMFSVWQNTTAANYASQVALLRDGGVVVDGSTYRLNSSTVHAHRPGATAVLEGATASQAALDWFFASAEEVRNLKPGEVVTPIT
jgi:hypothetical protein